MEDAGQRAATLAQYLGYLAPRVLDEEPPPAWPPDVFAVALSLLRKSGAYDHVVEEWPPDDGTDTWEDRVGEAADEWYETWSADEADRSVPGVVEAEWGRVRSREDRTLAEIRGSEKLCRALLTLVAVSDETMAGIGFEDRPSGSEPRCSPGTEIWIEAHARLNREISNLCSEGIHAQVLPKYLGPRSGLTPRSLSHYLALNPHDEVTGDWYMLASLLGERGSDPDGEGAGDERDGPGRRSDSINLLLWPRPREVAPSQFDVGSGKLENLPERYGFFRYQVPAGNGELIDRFEALLREAESWVGSIDVIVLPEMAVTPAEWRELRNGLEDEEIMLVAGVMEERGEGEYARNKIVIDVPWSTIPTELDQLKHHRWLLDEDQIRQYGLGARLDPQTRWWEAIEVGNRQIRVFSLDRWLSMCCLVCEDLAQAEPVAGLLRAVGPSFVLALLMDGPQLRERWPSRYATVLADDPGSSVLTFTSLGMATLSRPPGKSKSRAVGLWKDADTGRTIELSLDQGADALVVSLSAKYGRTWTADGRERRPRAGFPALSGVHQISVG